MQDAHPEVDRLLQRAADGGPAAEELFALLYGELHRLAEHTLRRDGGSLTLGTTTLLHEAYLRIVGRTDLVFDDRVRFFAYASRAMRSLVIDFARRRRALKRGAQFEITLDDDAVAGAGTHDPDMLLRVGDAVTTLAAVDASLAELVDLHFFGGFSLVEIAGFRGVSERTVQRDWRKARLLLRESLQDAAS
jgi:RNA polymerase sigma factor (TIGR02999 family)